MTNKLGTTTSARGYVRAATQGQEQVEKGGRAAPDQHSGFVEQRAEGFGGGPEGLAAEYGPGQPEQHDEPNDRAPVAEEDLRETPSGDVEGRVTPGRPHLDE